MNKKFLAGAAVFAAVLAAAWFARDSVPLRPVAARLGLPSAEPAPDTASTLAAAGVHKCRVGARVVYTDQACPAGSRELAAHGGTVTVVSFPKPSIAQDLAPAFAAIASGVASGALIQGMSPQEVERMRERMIQQAGDR